MLCSTFLGRTLLKWCSRMMLYAVVNLRSMYVGRRWSVKRLRLRQPNCAGVPCSRSTLLMTCRVGVCVVTCCNVTMLGDCTRPICAALTELLGVGVVTCQPCTLAMLLSCQCCHSIILSWELRFPNLIIQITQTIGVIYGVLVPTLFGLFSGCTLKNLLLSEAICGN